MTNKNIEIKKIIFSFTVVFLFILGFFIVPSLANAAIKDIFNDVCNAFRINGITWEEPVAAGEEINDDNPGSCEVCPGGTTMCSDNICRISCVGVDPGTCTDGKKGVYVIGDNLTALMETEGNLSGLIRSLGWSPVTVNGKQGRDIGEGIDLVGNNNVAKNLIKESGAVVIALGTSGNYPNLGQRMGILFNGLKEINPGIRYYFVNYSGSNDRDVEREMNRRSGALSSFVDANKEDGAMLIDWNSANKSVDPPYTDADPAGIHPIGNYDKMAQAVARRIGRMPNGGICSGGKCGEKAVELATSQIGIPYQWGGCHSGYRAHGPRPGCAAIPPHTTCQAGGRSYQRNVICDNDYDCSGLVNWAWYWASNKQVDIIAGYGAGIISSSELQLYANKPSGIPADAKVGDVLGMYSPNDGCTYTSHIAIYAGNGMMVEAPCTGCTVRRASVPRSGVCWTHVKSCE